MHLQGLQTLRIAPASSPSPFSSPREKDGHGARRGDSPAPIRAGFLAPGLTYSPRLPIGGSLLVNRYSLIGKSFTIHVERITCNVFTDSGTCGFRPSYSGGTARDLHSLPYTRIVCGRHSRRAPGVLSRRITAGNAPCCPATTSEGKLRRYPVFFKLSGRRRRWIPACAGMTPKDSG